MTQDQKNFIREQASHVAPERRTSFVRWMIRIYNASKGEAA